MVDVGADICCAIVAGYINHLVLIKSQIKTSDTADEAPTSLPEI